MAKAMNDQCIPPGEGVLHHAEGVDLIPANIELAGMEVALVNTMSREKMLKQVLDSARQEYDYADLYDSANFEAKKMIVNQLIRRVDVYRGYQINISFNFDLTPYIEGE